jgi:hypothetical protein
VQLRETARQVASLALWPRLLHLSVAGGTSMRIGEPRVRRSETSRSRPAGQCRPAGHFQMQHRKIWQVSARSKFSCRTSLALGQSVRLSTRWQPAVSPAVISADLMRPDIPVAIMCLPAGQAPEGSATTTRFNR